MWRKTSPRNYFRRGQARLKRPTYGQMTRSITTKGFSKIKVGYAGEAKYCI